jgi:CHAD domain-containing protein
VKARPIDGLDPGAPLRANARLIVRVRLEELRSLAEEATEPGAVESQHDMRIAAKRLRYVLEITEDCFGEPAVEARGAAKRLQQVLGDLHDCDVMLPRVAGQDPVESLLRRRRELLFGRFQDLWRHETSSGTWAALERLL